MRFVPLDSSWRETCQTHLNLIRAILVIVCFVSFNGLLLVSIQPTLHMSNFYALRESAPGAPSASGCYPTPLLLKSYLFCSRVSMASCLTASSQTFSFHKSYFTRTKKTKKIDQGHNPSKRYGHSSWKL